MWQTGRKGLSCNLRLAQQRSGGLAQRCRCIPCQSSSRAVSTQPLVVSEGKEQFRNNHGRAYSQSNRPSERADPASEESDGKGSLASKLLHILRTRKQKRAEDSAEEVTEAGKPKSTQKPYVPSTTARQHVQSQQQSAGVRSGSHKMPPASTPPRPKSIRAVHHPGHGPRKVGGVVLGHIRAELEPEKPVESRSDAARLPKHKRRDLFNQMSASGPVPSPLSLDGPFVAAASLTLTKERIEPPEELQAPVPQLAQALRELPLTRDVSPPARFDRFFETIAQPDDVNPGAFGRFVTSSRDDALLALAKAHNVKFMASSSSTTSNLSHFHYLFCGTGPLNMSVFSEEMSQLNKMFSPSSLKPSVTVLRRRGDGIWGIDNYPQPFVMQNQILIELGKIMEKCFTMEPEEYKRLVLKPTESRILAGREQKDRVPKDAQEEISLGDDNNEKSEEHDAYAFSKYNSLLLRSQLDCIDQRLAGENKVFDLKTRATLPIRVDVSNYKLWKPYKLTKSSGMFHSFEREEWDMVRSALLKYSMQCRIGDMHGVAVAYHNTEDIFGFQYITVEDMDRLIYGNSHLAKQVYFLALKMYEFVLKEVSKDIPADEQTFKMLINAVSEDNPNNPSMYDGPRTMRIFIERLPTEENDLQKHMRWAERWTSALRVDAMSDEEIKRRLEELELSTEGDRFALVNRLEKSVVSPDTKPCPPASFFHTLVQQDLLREYELRVVLKVNGQSISGPATSVGDDDQLDVDFQFKRVNEPNAAERYRVLYTDYRFNSRILSQSAKGDANNPARSPALGIPMTEEDAEVFKQMTFRAAVNATIQINRDRLGLPSPDRRFGGFGRRQFDICRDERREEIALQTEMQFGEAENVPSVDEEREMVEAANAAAVEGDADVLQHKLPEPPKDKQA